MQEIKVLYDGWPLAYAPNSAAATHLRTLLQLKSEKVKAFLGMPKHAKLDEFTSEIELVPGEESDLGKWQQRSLPAILKSSGAQIIHTTLAGASLFGRHKTMISPSALSEEAKIGGRFSAALGQGGLARAEILWPEDLPQSELPGTIHRLPSIAHPDFFIEAKEADINLDFPDSYLLYQGDGDEAAIRQLLEAWTWAAASIGEIFPLLMLGLNEKQKRIIEKLLAQYHVEEYVQLLPELDWRDLVAVYKGSSAVIVDDKGSLWGGAARLAMAAGKSVVAARTPALEQVLGKAAYLVEPGDLRAFGAAMITVVVDESVWEKLEDASQNEAARWDSSKFSQEVELLYKKLI